MHSRKDVGSPPGYRVSAAEWYTMNLVNPSTLQLFPRSSCYVNLSAHLVCQCKHAVLQSCSHHNARSAGFSHVATCFSPFSLFGCLRWAVSHLWCNTLLPHRVKLQLHDPIFAKRETEAKARKSHCEMIISESQEWKLFFEMIWNKHAFIKQIGQYQL